MPIQSTRLKETEIKYRLRSRFCHLHEDNATKIAPGPILEEWTNRSSAEKTVVITLFSYLQIVLKEALYNIQLLAMNALQSFVA